ncbi:MAG TPA: thioredoxin family protein [Promicromonospora sp.]|nr:thioredoxin family protein [Promicromonospora sp.]
MSSVQFELFTSAFCGPCHQARAAVTEAVRLIPDASLVEHDVVHEAGLAEQLDIRTTPTVLVRTGSGAEVFRAAGAPTVPQALAAAARALEA